MPDNQQQAAEYLENINFGDGEPAPTEEPRSAEPQPPREPEPPEPPESPETPEAQEPDPAEKRARDLGWRPKEQWNGDPDRWVDADKFLERGETILPILKKNNEKLSTKIQDLETKLKSWETYHKQDRERVAKREYERGLNALKAKQREAVEQGDTYEYEKLEKERETLDKAYEEEVGQLGREEPAQGQEGQLPQPPEAYLEWHKENPWFEKDPELTAFAKSAANFVESANPNMDVNSREFFDTVTKEVKTRFPEKFENPRRSGAQGVEGSDLVGGRSGRGGKTFNDLPPEAKQACLSMERAGMTRKQYVAEYFGTDAISIGD